MRLRNIPQADKIIAASPFCIHNPAIYRGTWHSVFKNDHPIHIEIGMGKGRFILQLAQQNKYINFIGIEKYASVLLRAVQKLESVEAPSNMLFLCINAESLPEIFAPGEISRIYLNFSDPWPKERHSKRRLTSGEFLARYEQILDADGTIEFKTDNRSLFDFSLQEFSSANWNLKACTYDLHHDTVLNQENIMTEYEEKFSSMGNPIYKLITSHCP